MKAYNKPTIEFIELKPEERLACGSSGGGSSYYYWRCNARPCWYWWCPTYNRCCK